MWRATHHGDFLSSVTSWHSPSVHMGTRIFYLAKCRYKHPYQAEPGRNLRSGLGFFFCPFARAYSVQLSFHLDQRQAAAPSRELLLWGLAIFLACVFRVLRGQALGFIISIWKFDLTDKGRSYTPALVFGFLCWYHVLQKQIRICAGDLEWKIGLQ